MVKLTFYDNLASFQAASSTNVAVTFEGFAPADQNIGIPPNPPITLGGVSFTPLAPAPNLVVATPGAVYPFTVPRSSNVLTVSGNENIDMDFAAPPTAVGFDTYLNPYDPPVVAVYDTNGNLIATHTLTQAASTVGFIGITSSVPIGKVNWLADRGGLVNTAVDNVRVGTIRPHDLKFYLHGADIPETAGGFTMNEHPAPGHTLNLGLLSSPSWFSDPALTGTFLAGATFKLVVPMTVGLSLGVTYRLSATNADGSGAQLLGQTTRILNAGTGTQTITIPVSTPVTFNNKRLKLTISSGLGIGVSLQMGPGAYVEATRFVGTP